MVESARVNRIPYAGEQVGNYIIRSMLITQWSIKRSNLIYVTGRLGITIGLPSGKQFDESIVLEVSYGNLRPR
jgi:hypothetical protein